MDTQYNAVVLFADRGARLKLEQDALEHHNKTSPHNPAASWDMVPDYRREASMVASIDAVRGLFLPDGWYAGAYLTGPFLDSYGNIKSAPVKVMLEIPMQGDDGTFNTKIIFEAELPGLPKGVGEFGHLPGVRVRLEGGRVAEWSFFVRGLPGTPSPEPAIKEDAPEGEEGTGND